MGVNQQQNEPEQHAQSVKNPQLDTLNRTQADSRQDAAKSRQERNAASSVANTWLGRISLGIQQLHDALAPQQTEGNIGEQAPYLMRGQQEGTAPVKVPQPTKEGAALLGWMRPALANLERLYNLPAGLLRSVALAESGGDQFATSKAGAQGMFQFMPDTAKDLGLKGNDAFDPMKSADAAARYLSQLLRRSGGDLSKALASYNWGMGNVEKYGMNLLPRKRANIFPACRAICPSRPVRPLTRKRRSTFTASLTHGRPEILWPANSRASCLTVFSNSLRGRVNGYSVDTARLQSRKIGMIIPDVVVSEKHSDTLEITEHPVETGAAISDHAYKRPSEVVMEVGLLVAGRCWILPAV
jgi:soluble lytic murein transglycosylase-like protein